MMYILVGVPKSKFLYQKQGGQQMVRELFAHLLGLVGAKTIVFSEWVAGKQKPKDAFSYRLLLSPQRTSVGLLWALILSATLLIAVVLSFIYPPWKLPIPENDRSVIYGALISVAASVFAGYFYLLVEERANARRVRKISGMADQGLIASILRDLDFFKKDHLKDYVAKIELKTSDKWPDNIVTLEITLEMDRPILTNHLYVTFVRDGPQASVEELEKLRQVADREIINQRFDESTIDEEIKGDPDFVSMYALKWLSISNVPQGFVKLTERGNRVSWKSERIDARFIRRKRQRIRLCFTVPMEIESFYNLQLEYPTHIFSLTADFGKISDKLSVSVIDSLTSPLCANLNKGSSVSQGLITLHHSEWLLPGSNVVVLWYKK